MASIPAFYLLSLFEAITRSQSLTLCFFKYFLVKYLRYLHTSIILRTWHVTTQRNSQGKQLMMSNAVDCNNLKVPLGHWDLSGHRQLCLVLLNLDRIAQNT